MISELGVGLNLVELRDWPNMTAYNPSTYKSRAIFIKSGYLSEASTIYVYRLTPLYDYVQYVAVIVFSIFGVARTTTIYPCTGSGNAWPELDVLDCWQHMENPVEALHQLGYEAVDIPNTGEISVRQ